MKKLHTLWIEKYRSQTLDQYVCSQEFKSRLQSIIERNDIPHLILAGSAGTGKTTLAKLLINNIKCDYLYLNASDENGIDVIRDKVKQFASTASFQPLKVIILDEADFLTQPAQAALRNLIEEYSANTRFIFTCNYIEKLIEPLQSRCEIHSIKPPSMADVAKHICENILDVEDIEYEMKDIAVIIKRSYPDVRSIIKNLQAGIKDNKFVILTNEISYLPQILSVLQKPTKTSWVDIRQIVANDQVDDYQPVIEYLYEHIEKYGKGHEAEITIELDEAQWRSKMVPDKEINMMSLISKILKIIK
jgi:DNA polymerase III delta prime subunit